MNSKYSIALVSSDESIFREMRQHVGAGFQVAMADGNEKIEALIQDPASHGVVLDLDSLGDPATDGAEVLQEIRRLREDMMSVAFSRRASPTLPLLASQAGADEFLLAPLDFRQLSEIMLLNLEKRALMFEGQRLVQQVESKSAFCGIVGGSEPVQKLYKAIQAVADSNASVLIRGESGVGKELVAHAIVESGDRREQPFICLNCSALPESLVESELFGYEKGAFTGADAMRPGLIEAAHGGTLFLDEITTLNHALQAKLLRVLQERSVQRLGGRTTKKIDFRLITATNDDLEDMVKKGRFREDLYYRINVVPIFVPPLRERKGDIPLLSEHFLRAYCAANKKPMKQLQPEVLEILEDYSWPGNVRELENAIQRLVVMNDTQVISAQHLPQQLLYSSTASQEAILIPEEGVDFDAELDRIQVAYLRAALRRTGGRKSAAAGLLRMDPQRMKYLCRKLKVENPAEG